LSSRMPGHSAGCLGRDETPNPLDWVVQARSFGE
jgi:hypothetical protein